MKKIQFSLMEKKYDRMGLLYNLNQNQRDNCHIMDTGGKGTNGNWLTLISSWWLSRRFIADVCCSLTVLVLIHHYELLVNRCPLNFLCPLTADFTLTEVNYYHSLMTPDVLTQHLNQQVTNYTNYAQTSSQLNKGINMISYHRDITSCLNSDRSWKSQYRKRHRLITTVLTRKHSGRALFWALYTICNQQHL